MKTPVSIYVVHHPECTDAEGLAKSLYDWFRLGYLSGDQSGAGLPVYYRRQLDGSGSLLPKIRFEDAALNLIVVLVDQKLVLDDKWRAAAVELADTVGKLRKKTSSASRVMLLPVAMHDSFYRSGPLYEGFNPIRLLDMNAEQMEATLRRAVTEAAARTLRGNKAKDPPPLEVFLSHAKRDGRQIAEQIRDEIRNFGQLVAWYDANDLPYGASWESPMTRAAGEDTAAMIATLTDAYPTRPWCRKEAALARTPVKLQSSGESRVWKIQPVVAVQKPGHHWARGVPMLEGVPRIGWERLEGKNMTELIVDRLVLEVMLGLVHRKVATELEKNDPHREKSCYLTWVPDPWTLSIVRHELGKEASSIERIVYPGYGLSIAEIAELEPVLATFSEGTKLVSFEEAMP